MKRTFFTIFTTILSLAMANAQTDIRVKQFNLEKRVAIKGYDPVTYFTLNKAIKGNSNISTVNEGVTYYFSTDSNKELFLKDLKKYEPQYGGWCAYAMGATNEKVDIDPETFKISNGRLYLFYHTWVNNTLPKWNADETNLKAKADKNWQIILLN